MEGAKYSLSSKVYLSSNNFEGFILSKASMQSCRAKSNVSFMVDKACSGVLLFSLR